jgi:gliding motility-associated protein GldE
LVSALISGSETAYFSLSPQDIDRIKHQDNKKNTILLRHLVNSDYLLSAILLLNNLINIAIVLLSTFIINSLIDFSHEPGFGFFVQTITVTFVIVLFGDVIPKILASQYAMPFARFMAYPLLTLEKAVRPASFLMVKFTKKMYKRFNNIRSSVSIAELSQAVDITTDQSAEDKEILKGIVRFVNMDVKEIMRPRIKVEAISTDADFLTLRSQVIECGYSRIPVFEQSLDNIRGLLYVKDLLPYMDEQNPAFDWCQLIRKAYFVPESKKINDLLEEFRQKKIHLAIVVDEYGGTEGIVTLEDILEEIVGEISDETD